MSVEIQWYIEPRVLLIKGTGSITVEDSRTLDEKAVAFLNQSTTTPIHLLFDGSLIERMPGLMILKKWIWPKHQSLGDVVVFGLEDTPLRMVTGVIFRLFGLTFHFQDTFEKAAKSIRKIDESLPVQAEIPMIQMALPTKPLKKTRISKTVSEELLKVFNGRCEYCHTPQDTDVKIKVVEIDPEQKLTFDNLAFACDSCRDYKHHFQQQPDSSGIELFHPRRDYWYEHFQWGAEGLALLPITMKAQNTIEYLGLNSEDQIARRSQGMREGWHAPDLVRTNHFQDDFFPEGGKLRLEIRDAITGQPVKMVIEPMNVLIFGRSDAGDPLQPDINLGPYGGYRMGVSHIHARINPPLSNALTINDMGSTNGTFVNDSPVKLNEACRLCDGDEIRMGNMVMRVFFESD